MRHDPITTEVVRHALETIADEMGNALRRTALSVVVKDMKDYSCALFDSRGRLLAAASRWFSGHGAVPAAAWRP